jgi:Spy/CpxP family protein refolding chaperone
VNALKSLCLALLLALSVTAHAEEKDDWLRGKLFPPDVVMKHQAALKLTDAQRKAIRAELTSLQGKVAAVDWDIMEAGLEMQEQIARLPVDREAVLSRAERVFEAENRKKRAWLEMLVNIKNQLTPEQVAYLARVAAAEPPR